MKREDREQEGEQVDVPYCLMSLSKVGGQKELTETSSVARGRLFTCKTCNREFSSFQALGGHRASHKKPKLAGDDLLKLPKTPAKPKTHDCSICGHEFTIGQALGGHMRRRRAADNDSTRDELAAQVFLPLYFTKNSNNEKVFCFDLNLTPMENDVKIKQLLKFVPLLNCLT